MNEEINTMTEGPVLPNPDRLLSYGEKAVGLSFNPSNDPIVYNIKSNFANVIDTLNNLRDITTSGEVKRLLSIAITEAQTAQMWAVKAVTYKD